MFSQLSSSLFQMLGSMPSGLHHNRHMGVFALVEMDPENMPSVRGFARTGFQPILGGSIGLGIIPDEIDPGDVPQQLFHFGPSEGTMMCFFGLNLNNI